MSKASHPKSQLRLQSAIDAPWRNIYSMVDPAAGDLGIATATANYILQEHPRHFFIFHDMRTKARGGSGPGFGQPCPVPYDWQRKNIIGISTDDRARAHAWIVAAMLKGYEVFYSSNKRNGGSPGSIEHVRERVREDRKRLERAS